MPKNYKEVILILILIGILVLSFLISKNYFKERMNIELVEKMTEFSINIDGTTLKKEENNFIYSSTLLPEINIFVPLSINIKSLSLKIDNSENILVDKFYGETSADEIKRNLAFRPSYMFTPQRHHLIVEYQNLDGELFLLNFDFILIFNERFNESLRNSKVWIIPKNRPSEWFNVESGKLLIKPTTNDNLSSLAFLYAFEKDLTVDFELIPVRNKVSMIFYFLEFGSFTIGSNNNRTIVLIRSDQDDFFGKSFELLEGHRYHIHIVRNNFEYKLGIKELFNRQNIDPMGEFSENDVLLDYIDKEILNNDYKKFKQSHIGFSLWGNSDGVYIDNIFITGFAD